MDQNNQADTMQPEKKGFFSRYKRLFIGGLIGILLVCGVVYWGFSKLFSNSYSLSYTSSSDAQATEEKMYQENPWARPIPSPVIADDCTPALNLYGVDIVATPISPDDFYNKANELEGTTVSIEGYVVESRVREADDGSPDGTVVLLRFDSEEIEDGFIIGMALLLDRGVGIDQFVPGSSIRISGKHFGYSTPPENFFETFPNPDEALAIPAIIAGSAGGGICP